MPRNKSVNLRSTSLEWWRVREVRDLATSLPSVDAKTLKRLHRYGERERQGLHPLLWHQRVWVSITEPLRRLLRF